MDNLWSVLAQTLALSVTAAVLLAAKRLFLDNRSPRWQYGVWTILALRALLPADLRGRTLDDAFIILDEAQNTSR